MKNLIKQGMSLLKNPAQEFERLQKKTLEEVVGHYLKLLLLLAVVSALFNFIFALGKAFYFGVFRAIEIDYALLLNYILAESIAITFSYILTGTFLMFIVSIILKFLFKRIKYTELLKIMLYAASPLLLFCWTPYLAPSLLIWSAFLFSVGIKLYRVNKIAITSIRQRD